MRILSFSVQRACRISAGLALAALTPLHPQTAGDSTVMSARMLIRLGAAVSGYPTGLPVWAVTCAPYDQMVLGIFPKEREAESVARDSSILGRRCRARGPFLGTLDEQQQQPLPLMLFAAGTVHQPDSKYDSATATSSTVLSVEDIQDITITVHRRGGPEIVQVYRPDQVDAIFFTLPAMDKFLFPYYQWMYGVDYAARLRAAIRAHMMQALARQGG
jgi:hypothetical protein